MFCWLIGHKKKYVGVEDIVWADDSGSLKRPCVHDHAWLKHCRVCGKSVQIARWVCGCGMMGETFIAQGAGIYRVEFGKLVPDEKRWANHLAIISREI